MGTLYALSTQSWARYSGFPSASLPRAVGPPTPYPTSLCETCYRSSGYGISRPSPRDDQSAAMKLLDALIAARGVETAVARARRTA
jgi:hypothetical protein